MTLTNTLPVLVGHNDTLLHLYLPERGQGRNFFIRSDKGHIDLPRAREGGLAGGFFAIFVPAATSASRASDAGLTITDTGYEVSIAPAIDQAYAHRETMAMMANLFRLEAESEGQV